MLQQRRPKHESLHDKIKRYSRCLPGVLCLVLVSALLSISGTAFAAKKPQTDDSLIEYLSKEQTHLKSLIFREQNTKPPQNSQGYNQSKQRLSAIHTINAARIQSLEDFLDNQLKQKTLSAQKLKALQQLPLENSPGGIQEQVIRIEKKLELGISFNCSAVNDIKWAQQSIL